MVTKDLGPVTSFAHIQSVIGVTMENCLPLSNFDAPLGKLAQN